jgi:hypothetical protein
MSTTFNIIPTRVDSTLTFGNVLTLTTQTFQDQLSKLSINVSHNILVNIHSNKEKHVEKVNLNSKFIWADDEYAWFTFDNSNGGTDAYCEKIIEQHFDWVTYIEETLVNISLTPKFKQQIIDCEYKWYFRRSSGQSALMTIAYGHLAAAVAKLTDGYIYTYDGAWNDNIFPATSDQLLEVYFYPDKAKDASDYYLVTSCMEDIKSELASR